MIKKKQVFEQRDHLGGHLKNTCTHVLDICTRIIDKHENLDRDFDTTWENTMGNALLYIRDEVDQLSKWMQVPKYESYEYSPLNKYDNGDWWIEKHLSGKFIVTKEDADEIMPTTDDYMEHLQHKIKN